MSLIFYFAPHSTASVTANVLAELEHGRSTPLAERRELSIQKGETNTPEFLAVNPNGRVPTIVHEGHPIWESAAITMYLGEVFGVAGPDSAPNETLYPALGPQRGEAMKWIVWAAVNLAEAGSRYAVSLHAGAAGAPEEGSKDFVAPNEHSAKAGKEAKGDVMKCLDILEGALESKDFLLGKTYSLADTHVWSLVGWLTIMGISLDNHKNAKVWMERVGGRPALAVQN